MDSTDAKLLRRVAGQLRTYSDMRGAAEIERIAAALTAKPSTELSFDDLVEIMSRHIAGQPWPHDDGRYQLVGFDQAAREISDRLTASTEAADWRDHVDALSMLHSGGECPGPSCHICKALVQITYAFDERDAALNPSPALVSERQK